MKLTILIADPHPIVCAGIKATLAQFGAEFYQAHDYLEAEEILNGEPITITILETDMAGLEYHRDMYQLPRRFKHTLFIAHTIFYGPWLKDALLEARFMGLISKKIQPLSRGCGSMPPRNAISGTQKRRKRGIKKGAM